MPLTKSTGNMYDWITHKHSHLRGKCPHECHYCYVQAMEKRYGGGHYSGELRLEEKELAVKYGEGKTIFVEHCNDLFAEVVDPSFIVAILDHCRRYPDNTYVFQSKNPGRMIGWVNYLPEKCMLGTTIESTMAHQAMGLVAPHPRERAQRISTLASTWCQRTFVTIEPIMDFDVKLMLEWMRWIAPDFINIGADSKGTGLEEPSADKFLALIDGIKGLGIEIKQKKNLERLIGKGVK